jgi:hypothetical protein
MINMESITMFCCVDFDLKVQKGQIDVRDNEDGRVEYLADCYRNNQGEFLCYDWDDFELGCLTLNSSEGIYGPYEHSELMVICPFCNLLLIM